MASVKVETHKGRNSFGLVDGRFHHGDYVLVGDHFLRTRSQNE